MRAMMRWMLAVTVVASTLAARDARAEEYYVSAASGKGKVGSKAEPGKDMGFLVGKLKAGDTINMAGGVYLSKSETGHDTFDFPVKIIGGWDETFPKRHPWGATKTILSGDNKSKNLNTQARLEITLQAGLHAKRKDSREGDIVLDGLIVDNAARNRYAGDGAKIVRMADPKKGEGPTPESAGILVKAGKNGNATIENCVVMNCGPTTGALSVWGYDGSKITIRNNLIINNTGAGIEANSWWHPKDDRGLPEFTIESNTVVFSWKHDPFATYGGYGLDMDHDIQAVVKGNVFAFCDIAGVHNPKLALKLTLAENLLRGNLQADYVEFSRKIDVAKLDEAEKLSDASKGNVGDELVVPMEKAWSERFAARQVIDRNAAEADVKAVGGKANQWRRMLGLPQEGGAVKADSDVWLHRLAVEDALKAGATRYGGKFGCSTPAAK